METNEALVNRAHVKLLNAIAGQTGIRIVYDKDVATPYATADRVVHMPPPAAVEAWWYWVGAYHELGHLLPEMEWTYKELQPKLDMNDPLVMAVANIVVDNLNERNFYGDYAGVDKILDRGRSWIIKDWFKPEHLPEIKKNPAHSLVVSLILLDGEQRQDWMGSNVESMYLRGFEPGFEKYVKALETIQYKERIEKLAASVRPTAATKKLIYDILELIGHKPKEPQGQPENGEGQPQQGEGKPQPCEACEGEGVSKDTGKPCEACGGSGEEPPKGGEGKESSNGTHERTGEAPEEWDPDGIGRGHAAAKDLIGGTASAADIRAIEEGLKKKLEGILQKPKKAERDPHGYYSRRGKAEDYIPWTDIKTVEISETDGTLHHYEHAIRQALGASSISKQIAKYLKVMATDSYTYGQRRGKLHQKNIHKACGTQLPGVQPGIFKRKNSSILKTDSAVTILQDCSGSMGGSKYSIASACCVALNETLTDLRIPHEILGFTEIYKLQHYIFKRFGTQLTKDKMLRIMASDKVRMGNNADGESVHWAAQRLMERNEKRKLLIVLSDGSPAGCFEGDGRAYLKHICGLIETESPIDLVGIGIATDSPRRYYKHSVVVSNPNQLDTVLFGVLKDFLV